MILSNKLKLFSSNTPSNNNFNILFKIYTYGKKQIRSINKKPDKSRYVYIYINVNKSFL